VATPRSLGAEGENRSITSGCGKVNDEPRQPTAGALALTALTFQAMKRKWHAVCFIPKPHFKSTLIEIAPENWNSAWRDRPAGKSHDAVDDHA
jgi:hypothetical protein